MNHLIDFIKAVHQDYFEDLERYILKFILSPYLSYGEKLENEEYDKNCGISEEQWNKIQKERIKVYEEIKKIIE
jgi:hypothetical protein